MTSDVDEVTAERQRDVQRKLGRFLIRIQQYERLLKALVIDSEHEGTVDTMVSFKEERVKRFATKSLGIVVEELTNSYVQLSRPAGDEPPDDEPAGLGVDKPYFRFKAGIEMDAESFARTKADLENLVGLRNGVVHHLIEKFNVWTLDGCDAAIAHLDAAFATVDAAYSTLQQWAKTALEARAVHVQILQSSEFLNMLTYSVMPDGTVIWEGSPIVGLLKRCEAKTPIGEWTSLEVAIASLRASHPEHTPARYQCKTWRQVLTRSQQFEVRKVEATETLPGSTWYRSPRAKQ